MSEVFESITRRPLRAAATAFGVFWGIFMLTLLLGGGRGLRNGIDHMFAGDALNSVWVFTGRTSEPFEGLGAGRVVQLVEEDVALIRRGVPALRDLSPRTVAPAGLSITRGTRSAGLPMYGVYPAYAVTEKMTAVRGRPLNELDLERRRRVMVIGERARPLLFGNENPVGKSVRIGGLEFQVVGEFTDPGNDDEGRRVYLPFTTLAQTFDGSLRVDVIVATLVPGVSTEATRERLARLLSKRHRFSPKDHGAFDVWFMEKEYQRVESVLTGIDWAIVMVGLGTLLSGMVGVSNIMFVSVRERAQELGLRRALGATAGSVLRLVMSEALLLAVVSGGSGLLAAAALVKLAQAPELASTYFEHPEIDTRAMFGALGLLVVTALIAGYFPAREAARTRPIDALRKE